MAHISVLIAGTSNSYLEISKKMLKFHYENCEIDFAYTGQECVDKAFAKEYNLVLFDYEFADLDGLEIVDALLKKKVTSPLVMLIEEGEEKKAVQAIEQGATDYILKVRGYLTALPFTVRNLLEKKNPKKLKKVETPKAISTKSKKPILQSVQYFILDDKYNIISANSKIQKLTKMSEGELVELNFYDLLSKENQKPFFDNVNRFSKSGKSKTKIQTAILDKHGEVVHVQVFLTAIKDDVKKVISYKGELREIQPESHMSAQVNDNVNTLEMVQKITAIISSGYELQLPAFVERITEAVCQMTKFERGTFALLDKRRNVFIKQAMVGYGSFPEMNGASIQVSNEVIERVFAGNFKVKVIYYNQVHRNTASFLNSKYPERRSQKRRPHSQWHPRDLILVNLTNEHGTFGYISLDRPVGDFVPNRNTFENLEVLGQLISFAIENFYHFSTIEKRSRRLKQVLVMNNIFKLHLGLNELLREVVWSIKFSLDFNLIALGLISKRTGKLGLKAVACEDKVKAKLLSAMNFPVEGISKTLKSNRRIGKSYLILEQEDVLQNFKHVYNGGAKNKSERGQWPADGILLVPIKSQDGKIIGLIMVDDPADKKLPTDETVQILELLANQIGVAIDNRVLYVNSKNSQPKPETSNRLREFIANDSSPPLAFSPNIKRHRFVDKFFK